MDVHVHVVMSNTVACDVKVKKEGAKKAAEDAKKGWFGGWFGGSKSESKAEDIGTVTQTYKQLQYIYIYYKLNARFFGNNFCNKLLSKKKALALFATHSLLLYVL